MYRQRLLTVLAFLVALWTVGVVGYMVLEGWSLMEALYMTAISLTTVGYGEVRPLTVGGRIFTIILLSLGVGFFFYALGVLAEAAVEGHLKGIWERRRMEKAIAALSHHFVVCGFGRIGRTICREISERKIPVVVVENDPKTIEGVRQSGVPYVEGDATHDEILVRAGVERARGVICVLHTDADNVYVTLTARSLKPGLLIVARADDANAEKRMMQAGADRVICPYEIGARRMALAVLRPTVTEFLDLAVHSTTLNLSIEQVEIDIGSSLDGFSLKDAAVRQMTGTTILAVQQMDDEMVVSPGPDYVVKGGDIVVALGDAGGLKALRGLAGSRQGTEGP